MMCSSRDLTLVYLPALISDKPIPDLVSIIRRIQQLETTVAHLQKAAVEIAERRKQVLPATYQQIAANQEVISKLLREMGIAEEPSLDEQWEREVLQDKLQHAIL